MSEFVFNEKKLVNDETLAIIKSCISWTKEKNYFDDIAKTISELCKKANEASNNTFSKDGYMQRNTKALFTLKNSRSFRQLKAVFKPSKFILSCSLILV